MLIFYFQLDKVTKKIDRWHDQKSKSKECFEKDEEYVELDRSPTNFESSDDEEIDQISLDSLDKKHITSKGLESRITDNSSNISSKRRGAKSNPNSFKLSLMETNHV